MPWLHTGPVKFSVFFTLLTGPGMAAVRPALTFLLLDLEAAFFLCSSTEPWALYNLHGFRDNIYILREIKKGR